MKASVTQTFRKGCDTFTFNVNTEGAVSPEDIDFQLGRLEQSEYLLKMRKSLAEMLMRHGLGMESVSIKVMKNDE